MESSVADSSFLENDFARLVTFKTLLILRSSEIDRVLPISSLLRESKISRVPEKERLPERIILVRASVVSACNCFIYSKSVDGIVCSQRSRPPGHVAKSDNILIILLYSKVCKARLFIKLLLCQSF